MRWRRPLRRPVELAGWAVEFLRQRQCHASAVRELVGEVFRVGYVAGAGQARARVAAALGLELDVELDVDRELAEIAPRADPATSLDALAEALRLARGAAPAPRNARELHRAPRVKKTAPRR